MDIGEAVKLAITFAGPILSGGGVWAYMSSRDTAKTSTPAQIAQSQADLVSAVNDQTKTILNENRQLRRESNRERRLLKARADRQDRQISDLTHAVQQATAKHEDCETNLADVRALIDTMRKNEAADILIVNPHNLKDQFNGSD